MKRRVLERDIHIKYFFTKISDKMFSDYGIGIKVTMLGSFRAF